MIELRVRRLSGWVGASDASFGRAASLVPVLALLLFAGTSACQNNEYALQVRSGSVEPAAELGVVMQKGFRGAALAEACHQDQECVQPLRCIAQSCTIPPVVDGQAHELSGRVRFERGGELQVEMALTPFQRERGLMYVTRMHDDWGMLFVFESEQPRSFWMENTFVPLDMVFLDENRVVVKVIERAKPLEVGPRYQSGRAARFVIELNAGRARELQIEFGQRVEFLSAPGAM